MSETSKIDTVTGKRKPPRAGMGRPKGAVNKSTRSVKEAIEFAFEAIGGKEELVEWIKRDPENQKTFIKDIWPKLLPLQVTGVNGAPLITEFIIRRAGTEPHLKLVEND